MSKKNKILIIFKNYIDRLVIYDMIGMIILPIRKFQLVV